MLAASHEIKDTDVVGVPCCCTSKYIAAVCTLYA